jgi:hypothetical protein
MSEQVPFLLINGEELAMTEIVYDLRELLPDLEINSRDRVFDIDFPEEWEVYIEAECFPEGECGDHFTLAQWEDIAECVEKYGNDAVIAWFTFCGINYPPSDRSMNFVTYSSAEELVIAVLGEVSYEYRAYLDFEEIAEEHSSVYLDGIYYIFN